VDTNYIYSNYFNGPKEASRFRTNSATQNAIALIKCVSLLTLVIPFTIWACKSLFGRVSKTPPVESVKIKGIIKKELFSSEGAHKSLFEGKPNLGEHVEEIILSNLSLKDLDSLSKVSKRAYTNVAKSEALRIARLKAYAVGPEKWQKWGFQGITLQEINKAYQSLPKDILKILTSDCPIFKGKKVMETHMLVWVPGNLTLNELEKLPGVKYDYCNRSVSDELEKTQEDSCWVLMTKDVIPDSRDKTYQQQQELVEKLDKGNYEFPKARKAAVCIIGHFLETNEYLFGRKPWTYTRSEEKVDGYPVVVGGFSADGLNVSNLTDSVNVPLGVAAFRKFL
jgi:hypothetical protein